MNVDMFHPKVDSVKIHVTEDFSTIALKCAKDSVLTIFLRSMAEWDELCAEIDRVRNTESDRLRKLHGNMASVL